MTKKLQLLALFAGVALCGSVQAGPPVRVGVGIGIGVPVGPVYRPYPYYGPYYRPYYYPPPVVYAPPPAVIYQPAPVVVQQPTIIQQQPAVVQAPAPQPPVAAQPQPTTIQATAASGTVNTLLNNLRSTEENVRRESVLELGRLRAVTAVQPLTATLAGDQSPVVREAAARALGMIGAPQSLTALTYAAQADPDRDVRHSANFAVDIIKSR
jgi:hypothetical protein